MNTFTLIVLLVVAIGGVVSAVPQFVVTAPRKIPGQRRLGTVNYGQYRFGRKGYQRKVHSRKRNKD